MANPIEDIQETLKGKTAGVPNWAWVAILTGAIVLWLLRAKKPAAGAPQTLVGTGVASGSGGSLYPVSSAAGPSTPPVASQPTPPSSPQPITGPTGPCLTCPPQPAPSPTPGGAAPVTFGPTPAPPAPVPAPAPGPNVAWSADPGVSLGNSIGVHVGPASGGLDSITVWAVGVQSQGDQPGGGWHQWGSGSGGGNFTVSIPTGADYNDVPYVIVALELRRGGAVVATGNPGAAGYDGRLRQVVAIVSPGRPQPQSMPAAGTAFAMQAQTPPQPGV